MSKSDQHTSENNQTPPNKRKLLFDRKRLSIVGFPAKRQSFYDMTRPFTNENHITQHGAWLANNTPNK